MNARRFSLFVGMLLIPMTSVASDKGVKKTEKRVVKHFSEQTGCARESVSASFIEKDDRWYSFEVTGCGKDARISNHRYAWTFMDDLDLGRLAAFDLSCGSLEMSFLGLNQRAVTGCEQKARYVLVGGTWVLDERAQ